MAHGFTQRNQRADDIEEKLRTDIIIDFNEFEQIQKEADSIIGSAESTEKKNLILKLKSKAEQVLRSKLSSSSGTLVYDDVKRQSSYRYQGGSSDQSPLDVIISHSRLRRNSDAYLTKPRMPEAPNAFLEEIEEELRHGPKKERSSHHLNVAKKASSRDKKSPAE